MTILVGITNGEIIHMGADRGASDEESILPLRKPKVNIRGDWIYAHSGSLGTGQLMHCITMPDVEDYDPFIVLRMNIVEELKSAVESFGSDSPEHAAEFLIGAKGRLFELSTADWGVAEVEESALGSGGAFGLGSLYSTKDYKGLPAYRVQTAIESAIHYSPTCLGPIDILYL